MSRTQPNGTCKFWDSSGADAHQRHNSAMSEVRDLLRSWGCEAEIASIFESADIDLEALQLLDDETLRQLLSPGVFLRFRKVLASKDLASEIDKIRRSKRRRLSSDTLTLTSIAETAADTAANLVSTSEPSSSGTSPVTTPTSEEIEENDVKELRDTLRRTFQGRVLLGMQKFEDTDRNSLAELIICNELRKSLSSGTPGIIPQARFKDLAETVTKLFPLESKESFYTPYKKVNNQIFYAKGKFTSQYYSWRAKGVSSNLFSKSTHSTTTDEAGVAGNLPVVSPELKESLTWITTHMGPFNVAAAHWKVSHDHRKEELDDFVNPVSIEQYLSTYPLLRQPWGYELLYADYSARYPGTSLNLQLNWRNFASKLVSKLEKVKGFDTAVISDLKKTLSEETDAGVPILASECHKFLLHYSKIFQCQVVVRGRRPNHWLATKAEMQEGFLVHLPNEAALDTHIQNRVKKLMRFKKAVPFQPFAAIVGDSQDNIEKSFVIVQATDRYKVNSPFEAVDTTFKVIQALNALYPTESKAMWRLLQKCVYKVDTVWDDNDVIPYLNPLLKYFA